MRSWCNALLLALIVSLQAAAQDSYTERAKSYVKQYAAYAIADQKLSGVPASVTLAQGILETEAGISELVTQANNHFGIKCKNNWTGETFLHTDDAKNECFKKYANALESYNDHSMHLHRNPRYKVLFTFSVTDYARWAHGLKKCGYATNPRYANQLIKIIEDLKLQEYTYAAQDTNYVFEDQDILVSADQEEEDMPVESKKQVASQTGSAAARLDGAKTSKSTSSGNDTSGFAMIAATADSARAAIRNNVPLAATYPAEEPIVGESGILVINGLKAIRGHKEDALLQYAVLHKIRYARLLELNDLPDEPLAFDTYIYLERKHNLGLRPEHVVREGESLLIIAQNEGMQLKKLASLNQLNPHEQPRPGSILQLQRAAATKPPVLDYTMAAQLPDTAFNESLSISGNNSLAGTSLAIAQRPSAIQPGYVHGDKAELTPGENSASDPTVPVDATVKKTPGEVAKQPFTKSDPSQPQLKKPATEKEYKKGDRYHIVKRGETAYSIAKRNNITVAQLLKWNHMEAQDLKAGQTIIIKE
jgi:LysM repeat protein